MSVVEQQERDQRIEEWQEFGERGEGKINPQIESVATPS